MIIASSDVGMSSTRVYRQRHSMSTKISTSGGNSTGGIRQNSGIGPGAGFFGFLNYNLDSLKRDSEVNKETGLLGNITDGNGKSQAARGASFGTDVSELQKSALQIRFETLNYLFMLLFGERMPQESEEGMSSFSSMVNGTGSFYGPTNISYEQTYAYEETETTNFSTAGRVVTGDGQEIEFGIDVTMSRSFYQEYTEKYSHSLTNYLDPLVIHLDGNATSVSDQSFFFDLDCDGVEDEISGPGAGNAFLALDKNEDGIIGDGSEIFGALTGNGFEELATYDLDGNGWIDEADEIFSRLRVYSKDENGNDILFTLKEAGVGAICLRALKTPFNITDENNQSRAMVRQSGFFLHENGGSGLIQQVDMAM